MEFLVKSGIMQMAISGLVVTLSALFLYACVSRLVKIATDEELEEGLLRK